MTTNAKNKTMDEAFFEEYTSHDAILKYTRATAGHGIGYLLDHDYRDVYLSALSSLPPSAKLRGIRILEFGCGGGMNLVHLMAVLRRVGFRVEQAIGTDFSPLLIDAARKEAALYLPDEDQGLVQFHVARNESLVADLETALGAEGRSLPGSFDFILGVNTIRYTHTGGREADCVRDILALLRPGGVCVAIDMNDRFPAFRSALKNKLLGRQEEECYIPSLAEYAAPFEQAGYDMLRKEHFCWVPHSGGRGLVAIMRALAPLLNTVAKSRAMRSLVVARKPSDSPPPRA